MLRECIVLKCKKNSQRVLDLEAQQSTNNIAETNLQKALAELEELKAARERQMEVMRDLMAKRDLYLFS